MEVDSFDPKGKKFLAITAHPDDADFCAGGTMLKWIAAGAKGAIVIATNGDKGSHDSLLTSAQLSDLRQEEQLAASEMLGLEHTWFLNFLDAHLEVTQELKSKLVKIIREYKPDVVLTWDPTMLYSLKQEMINHSDHRSIGQAAIDATYPMARDFLTFPEHQKENLLPHCVTDLFLLNFENPNYLEEIDDQIEKKVKLLKTHKSQIDSKNIEETVKNWSAKNASFGKTKYAESFVHLTFEPD